MNFKTCIIYVAAGLALGFSIGLRQAVAEVMFSATVDRNRISDGESVLLKFTIEWETASRIGNPKFSAPDFDLVNEFNQSFTQSYYENGRFGTRNSQQITKVLKSRKKGALKISDISISVDGTVQTVPPIAVNVEAGGAAASPPSHYGGSGVGLRGAGKQTSGRQFFLRVELDKNKAYKGEQVIVTYYLYRRVRVFQAEASRYPNFNGFLREDLEMPILTGQMAAEPSVLDGVVYERSLVARFAAYPLKDGRLKIDPLSIKVSYQNDPRRIDPSSDDVFMNLFSQLAQPMIGTAESEAAYLDVVPVPFDGRPASFSGGVGDFSVTSAVDKYEVRANEAITLTLKVEGRGNIASIEEPKAHWPDQLELYDSKGHAKTGRAGVGEKIFEFLLIPRVVGRLTLPPLEFSFFDPAKNAYVTKSSDPIEINVLEPASGGASDAKVPDIRSDLKPLDAANPLPASFIRALFSSRIWVALSGFGLFALFGIGLWDWKRKARLENNNKDKKKSKGNKTWNRIRAEQEVASAYELLSGAVYDLLDRVFDVGARSLSRRDLGDILTKERGLSDDIWKRVSDLLEFAELVRFASATSAVSEHDARGQLEKWVSEGRALEELLVKSSFSSKS